MDTTKISLFQEKLIRKTFHENEWWFVIEDVVAALTDSANPKDYLNKMRARDAELAKGYGQIVHPLGFETAGGWQKINCANTEGIFRIIQSIPSPKAEPFKLWLAKVGYERVQEIENPELATKRTRLLYQAKGYSENWIEKRMRGIVIREELTDEWGNRGAKGPVDYAILTAEISKATFGMTPGEYKEAKGLKRENLRDHMTDLELIFSMLGERATTEITRVKDSMGFPALKTDSNKGGRIAGKAREDLEREIGKPVVSKDNFLETPEKARRLPPASKK